MEIFVTGTDTDAGKTYATAWLARKLAAEGKKVVTQKFIQTGCTDSSEDKGAAALTDEALAALVGQNITDAKYDTVAGATVTSNAVNQALDTIAAHVRAEEVQ